MKSAIGVGTVDDSAEPAWSAAEERYAYVREVLSIIQPPPADLVELGAAPGAQCISLARDGYRVTAVDLGEAADEWGSVSNGLMTSAF